MIHVGQDNAEFKAYLATLVTTHEMRAQVVLQTLDGKQVADLSTRLLDGQVDLDAAADTTRAASLTLDDPDHSLHLDSDAPADGALFVDRLVAITYGVYVTSLQKWIDVPIFVGPIATMSRDGSTVAISCLGKEHLAKGAAWQTMNLRKGTNTVDAIRRVLRERGGERRFDFPDDVKARLPRPGMTLSRLTQPWAVAQQLARSIDRQLYYDGSGICRLRREPKSSAWTFTTGNGGTVLTQPQVRYDLGTIVNAVVFTGGKPQGQKHPVKATAVAGRDHPLSPWRLGRKINDDDLIPRYLPVAIDNDKVRSEREATATAKAELDRLLRGGIEVTFDALPVPHLDVGDKCRVVTDDLTFNFTLTKASIPLVHSGVMAVGANKRVTPDRQAIRNRQ